MTNYESAHYTVLDSAENSVAIGTIPPEHPDHGYSAVLLARTVHSDHEVQVLLDDDDVAALQTWLADQYGSRAARRAGSGKSEATQRDKENLAYHQHGWKAALAEVAVIAEHQGAEAAVRWAAEHAATVGEALQHHRNLRKLQRIPDSHEQVVQQALSNLLASGYQIIAPNGAQMGEDNIPFLTDPAPDAPPGGLARGLAQSAAGETAYLGSFAPLQPGEQPVPGQVYAPDPDGSIPAAAFDFSRLGQADALQDPGGLPAPDLSQPPGPDGWGTARDGAAVFSPLAAQQGADNGPATTATGRAQTIPPMQNLPWDRPDANPMADIRAMQEEIGDRPYGVRQCPHISNGVQCNRPEGHGLTDGLNHYFPGQGLQVAGEPMTGDGAATPPADPSPTPASPAGREQAAESAPGVAPPEAPSPSAEPEKPKRKRRTKLEMAYDKAWEEYEKDASAETAQAYNDARQALQAKDPGNIRLNNPAPESPAEISQGQQNAQAFAAQQANGPSFAPDPSLPAPDQQMQTAVDAGIAQGLGAPTQTVAGGWLQEPVPPAAELDSREAQAAAAFPCPATHGTTGKPCLRPAGHELGDNPKPHIFGTDMNRLAEQGAALQTQQAPVPTPVPQAQSHVGIFPAPFIPPSVSDTPVEGAQILSFQQPPAAPVFPGGGHI